MKLRRRELNVFSISALDLFASGMGAFVLLSVVTMPFFPNTGDSKERVEDLKGELEVAQSRAQDLERVIAGLQQADDMESAVLAELEQSLHKVEALNEQVRELQQQLAETSDESREQELERQLAATAEALRIAESQVEELQRVQTDLRLPHLDIVICLDVTGSMTGQIDGLKLEITSLAGLLDRLAPSVGIGLVAFGDRRWRQPIHEMPIVQTTNLNRIVSFVNSLYANMDSNFMMNTDHPEAVTTALERAVAASWRMSSEKRYVIAITDNAAYPDRITAALTAARRFAAAEDQFVSTVRSNFGPDPIAREAALRFLRDLAQAGNGNFVDAAGGESMISNVLLAIMGT